MIRSSWKHSENWRNLKEGTFPLESGTLWNFRNVENLCLMVALVNLRHMSVLPDFIMNSIKERIHLSFVSFLTRITNDSFFILFFFFYYFSFFFIILIFYYLGCGLRICSLLSPLISATSSMFSFSANFLAKFSLSSSSLASSISSYMPLLLFVLFLYLLLSCLSLPLVCWCRSLFLHICLLQIPKPLIIGILIPHHFFGGWKKNHCFSNVLLIYHFSMYSLLYMKIIIIWFLILI